MTSDRLFGLPHAEHLHRTPAEVYECDVDWDGETYPSGSTVTIEEWSTAPRDAHVPSTVTFIESLAELVHDSEGGWEGAEGWEPWKDEAVLAAAETFRAAFVNTIWWDMADRLIAEHTLTVVDRDGTARPLLNGEPLYRPKPSP